MLLAVTATALTVSVGSLGSAAAATFTKTFAAVTEPQPTGSLQALTNLPQYQPQTDQTLLDVTVELSSGLQGNVLIDNPTLRSQTVRINLAGTLNLFGPLSQPLLETTPSLATTQIIDEGTPALLLTGLETVTDTSTLTLSGQSPYVIEHFIGDGWLDLQLLSKDVSTVQGSSTLAGQFLTQAAATVRISYKTQPLLAPSAPLDVPEPSLLLGLTFWVGCCCVIEKTRNSKVR